MSIKAPTITDLDNSQRAVVTHIPYDAPMFVEGPPGSGKTHVAILRLQALLNNGYTNVLFLLYNHSMYGFLSTIFKKMGIVSNVEIDTKDIFFINAARRRGYDFGGYGGVYEHKYNGALETLLKQGSGKRYDVIVIDECQDFNNVEMTILNSMSSKIIAVGDFDQSVYISSPSPLLRKLPSRKLDTIYRYGKKVAKIAQHFSDSSVSLIDKVSINSNTDAYRVNATSKSDAFDKIVRIVNSKKHTNQSIAILSLNHTKLNELESGLSAKGLKVFKVVNNHSFRTYDFGSTTPILITPHSAKGMEFDVVILYGYDSYLNWSGIADTRDKIIYVSLTRTSNELYLIKENDSYDRLANLSEWEDLDTSERRTRSIVDSF